MTYYFDNYFNIIMSHSVNNMAGSYRLQYNLYA